MKMIKSAFLATLLGVALSKEMAQDKVKAAALYKTGIIHSRIMANKHVRGLSIASRKHKADRKRPLLTANVLPERTLQHSTPSWVTRNV